MSSYASIPLLHPNVSTTSWREFGIGQSNGQLSGSNHAANGLENISTKLARRGSRRLERLVGRLIITRIHSWECRTDG